MQPTTTNDAESGNITLWLSALPVETAPLLALLEKTTSTCVAGQACWHGYLRGRRLCVAVSGVGGKLCEQALVALLDSLPNVRVLLVGIAGAVNPALDVGDVVIASRAVSWPEQDRQAPRPIPVLGATGGMPGLRGEPDRGSAHAFRIVSGCILSWDELVCDELLKARLHESYGADCVDMETGYAARICAARGVPFLAIRGISDRANAQVDELESADLAVAVWHATIVAVEALTWSGGRASP
jgi:adenosylhomocysteine nucleosidase